MYADAVRCTHNGTGGTGTLTLAAQNSFPTPINVFGSSGTRLVYYSITEYTTSTRDTFSQYEAGLGSLVLSTGVLTRTPYRTAVGSTVNNNNPSAVNFGSTAANIIIVLGASAMSQRPAVPFTPNSADTYTPINRGMTIDSTSGGMTLAAGTKYYLPVEYYYGKAISNIAVKATSVATTGNVRLSVYDWGSDGNPGNLITEFTSGTQIAINTATGYKSLTLATPFWIPPGFYYFMVQADAAVQIQQASLSICTGAGSQGDRDAQEFTKGGTYGAAPNPADTGLTIVTKSAGGQLAVFIK